MKQSPFRYESWAQSHEGRVREHNEDRYFVDERLGLWVLDDGMGGLDAGEVASTGIVEQLKTIGVSTSASDQHARFVDRLTQANHEIQDFAQRRGSVVGSTVAALLIFEGEFRCVWVGDSRIYRIRDGALEQLTHDHSEVQELVDQGVLSREEARTWRGRNVITRAVGVYAELEPEVAYGEVEEDDIFLLCSDGLTAHASDDDILDAVTGRTAKEAGEMLLDLVLDRGATDNVTIIITQIRSPTGAAEVDYGAFAARH
jgi:protein phosphatase